MPVHILPNSLFVREFLLDTVATNQSIDPSLRYNVNKRWSALYGKNLKSGKSLSSLKNKENSAFSEVFYFRYPVFYFWANAFTGVTFCKLKSTRNILKFMGTTQEKWPFFILAQPFSGLEKNRASAWLLIIRSSNATISSITLPSRKIWQKT